jgi:protoporphyrinogen oxidase
MNRRGFLQISATALLPILLGIFPGRDDEDDEFTVEVLSNRSFGHLLRESMNTAPSSEVVTDYIIVGGGIAGMSAAMTLNTKNFLLFEAGDRYGGSSASATWKSTNFATGAHYELAYPSNFGQEVKSLLTEIDVIEYNEASQLHEFIDKKFVIKSTDQEQCFDQGFVRSDVLADATGLAEFSKALQPFEGQMPLPTRLIDPQHHHLNNITFKDFLNSKFALSADLEQRISYQMLDDWGGDCSQVSALAGIHYYMCRPYDTQEVELLSPPQGNSYFIEKMIGKLPSLDALKTNSLVRSVRETEEGVEAEILNVNGTVQLVKAKGLIYAGQKHALKYIMQGTEQLFSNDYVPWVVLNIVCKKGVDFSKWQNDVLTDKLNFLGFVSSIPQKTRSAEYDVFTAYYCFDSLERGELVKIEQAPRALANTTIDLIEEATGSTLRKYVTHVNVNLIGHAMPMAKPGYLTFSDVPSFSDKIMFAGVDTGRLPLFYEACDSGIQAAQKLMNTLT